MHDYQKIKSMFDSGELSQALPNFMTDHAMEDLNRHGTICYKVTLTEGGEPKMDHVPYADVFESHK